jgi:hypothetical protein
MPRMEPNAAAQLVQVHPSWFDWITVAAIVLGPILALLTQRALDWLRSKEDRREKLYFTLISTRAQWLSNEHVQAVNSIDVVFADDKNIRALWRKCLEHLATDEKAAGWNDTLIDLRVDLYQAIGNKLGYRYTTDYLKRGIYFPKHHGLIFEDQAKLLRGLATAVETGRLKVELADAPNQGQQ